MAAKKMVKFLSTFGELRKLEEKTQKEVADAMEIAQGEVSVFEKRESVDNVRVATLRRYLQAMGYELELVAVKDDKRIVIGQK